MIRRLFFSLLAGLYCLSCVDGVSPRLCHTMKKCSDMEVGLNSSSLMLGTNAKHNFKHVMITNSV